MAKPEMLRIANWDRWQSYRRDRGQPPWIKVHRQLLRDPNWVVLSDAQKGQLISIWMLAADRDGEIPGASSLIQKLCYLDEPPNVELLLELGFLTRDLVTKSPDESNLGVGKVYFIEYNSAIKIGFSKNPWARLNALKTGMPGDPVLLGYFDGTVEDEQELHIKFKHLRINGEWFKITKALLKLATGGLPDKLPASYRQHYVKTTDVPEAEKRREEESREEKTSSPPSVSLFDKQFEKLRTIYPKRVGDQRWHDAKKGINARLREGHTWQEILDGVERYAAFIQHTGKEKTEHVKQAGTFVGPGKPFLEPWELPRSKSERRQDSNVDAGNNWLEKGNGRERQA